MRALLLGVAHLVALVPLAAVLGMLGPAVEPEPVDRIDQILDDDAFIDSLNGGKPTDGWGKV